MPNVRRLLTFVQPYRRHLLFGIVALLGTTGLSLIVPLAIQQVVDAIFVQNDSTRLNRLTLALLALFAGRAAIDAARSYTLTSAGERIVNDLRHALHCHLLCLSPRFYADQRVGELVSRITNDVQTIQTALTSTIAGVVFHALRIVGALAILLWMEWRLTVFVLVAVPPVILVSRLAGRRLRDEGRAVQDALARATASVEESLTNIRLVQSFRREAYAIEQFGREVDATLQAALRRVRVEATFSPAVQLFFMGAFTVVAWFAGQQALAGRLTVGEVVAFLFYAGAISGSVSGIAGAYGVFQQAIGASNRIVELLDTAPEIHDRPGARPLPRIVGEIRFAHVSFAYDSRDAVLCDIDLTISPGETVALVGPSGAGKTTLVNLVPRLYDVPAGAVLIDGLDVRDVTLASLREQIALVPQETVLLATTVRENIRYGRLDATDAEIEAAARAANAHRFITELPAGYETPVGERGIKLSGGQRQRIALARAILRDPRILLLDEATSSLDSESEEAIQAALADFLPGRTTLIIAHRLSTVQIADRIVVLDDGRIVEEGPHDALLRRDGLYARLYRVQSAHADVHPL